MQIHGVNVIFSSKGRKIIRVVFILHGSFYTLDCKMKFATLRG